MHYAKDILEATRRPLLRVTAGHVSPKASGFSSQLAHRGYVAIPGYWSSELCGAIAEAIDTLICSRNDDSLWVDAIGSDNRYFHAERKIPSLFDFCDDKLIEEVRRSYTGRRKAEKSVLASRIDFRKGNIGSGGGWHRDSPHSLQFKAIMYLSDCYEENGPFQLIPGSNNRSLNRNLVRNGKLNASQYRFCDSEVNFFRDKCGDEVTLTGPKGTLILADVTCVHRGNPLKSGSRYALTLYCGDPLLS